VDRAAIIQITVFFKVLAEGFKTETINEESLVVLLPMVSRKVVAGLVVAARAYTQLQVPASRHDDLLL